MVLVENGIQLLVVENSFFLHHFSLSLLRIILQFFHLFFTRWHLILIIFFLSAKTFFEKWRWIQFSNRRSSFTFLLAERCLGRLYTKTRLRAYLNEINLWSLQTRCLERQVFEVNALSQTLGPRRESGVVGGSKLLWENLACTLFLNGVQRSLVFIHVGLVILSQLRKRVLLLGPRSNVLVVDGSADSIVLLLLNHHNRSLTYIPHRWLCVNLGLLRLHFAQIWVCWSNWFVFLFLIEVSLLRSTFFLRRLPLEVNRRALLPIVSAAGKTRQDPSVFWRLHILSWGSHFRKLIGGCKSHQIPLIFIVLNVLRSVLSVICDVFGEML